MADAGGQQARRAATLALGFLSDFQSNTVLGRRLHDSDRGVRLIAERGIRELWLRFGSDDHRQQLRTILRHNTAANFTQAIDAAGHLIDECPRFAEAWNQRAIAAFQQQRFDAAVDDCLHTLDLNPYHYGAAVGMAHGYLQLDDAYSALSAFRRAITLNPNMDGVRAQLKQLERALG